ncbi:type I phosphodiesterase/nucleotide pyrophosphatase [Gautieria morchelliformis]|nr:type I phosphodiesterase/nucleotide pyrophosphatase [Gautieria morchelliformis]
MRYWGLALASASVGGVAAKTYKHIAYFSIDGFHGSDVEKYVAVRPNSTIASLLSTGFEYTNAFTSAPSDSFPGTINQFTGASPRTTGVWYDDVWDRAFFPAGSNCTGPPGAEVQFAENIDFDSTLLFSGGINPANLPRTIIDGQCTSVTPHARLRVNTWTEIVTSKGLETAHTDKHPAYDILRGPSGTGLTTGFFPEIQAVPVTVNATIAYDQLHVNAFLDWLDGNVPINSTGSLKGVPTTFGGNFQAVSVAQKTVGYVAGSLDFTPDLLRAIDFVDNSIGQVVAKLTAKGLLKETLIIVVSKHGQAPIDPTLFGEVDPQDVVDATNVDVLFQTADDIALIFLKNQNETQLAVNNLQNASAALKIDDIIFGERLISEGFGNPLNDTAVPDIIVRPQLGIIFTNSKAKIAEHGGISDDDRHVACFVSNPKLKKTQFQNQVNTTQVAPTILKALGLNVHDLMGAQIEGTKVLDGF